MYVFAYCCIYSVDMLIISLYNIQYLPARDINLFTAGLVQAE